jgi:hypothetical protein
MKISGKSFKVRVNRDKEKKIALEKETERVKIRYDI